MPAGARAAGRGLAGPGRWAAPRGSRTVTGSWGNTPCWPARGRAGVDKRKPLLGFAALKDHLSPFPFSAHVVAAVKGRLAGYDLSKGTIRFTEAKPIAEDVIWEILDLRLQEID